jgi:ubiquinol-cytochrome c reductase cytochrome b subunit
MAFRVARWVDDQLGVANLAQRDFLRKVFPDHWSFMLGETALYSFVVLVLSGTYLAFFFHPGSETTVYDGSYAALQGVQMSEAYASALHISFEVQAGLFVRQLHHWAALVFMAAIAAHLARVFFTGAFRRPRQLNWMVGVTLLLVGLFSGFTGYSIVDDLLSGTGLAIGYSVVMSVPFIGPWLAFIIFGGQIANPTIVPRLAAVHIMILPALITVLLALHLGIMWRQKHTNYPGPGRTQHTIVGIPMWPSYAAKAIGFFLLVFGILALLGAFFQINPIWLYGPYDPSAVSATSQPDWYVGWLEGALRLMPAFEPTIFGITIPSPFIPGALLGLIMLAGLYLYPFLEAWVAHDHAVHHVLDRPSQRPVRTAIGVAGIAFFLVLLVAGSDDVIAVILSTRVDLVRTILTVLLLALPIVLGVATFFICRRLQPREAGAPAGDSSPPS